MSTTDVKVTFELADGRVLRAEWREWEDPATFDSPAEGDATEPTFYLDGVEVTPAEMPKGLDTLAELMYDDRDADRRFYVQTEYMTRSAALRWPD